MLDEGSAALAKTLELEQAGAILACRSTRPRFPPNNCKSLTTSLAKAMQNLRRVALEPAKPKASFEERGIRTKIARWLAADFLAELVRYDLQSIDGRWHLHFDFDHQAWLSLLAPRLGRSVLLTNRMDWTAGQVVAASSG